VALSAIDAITPAFQHAKQQLFQPFRAGQWAKLALVGFLAGELSSGGCNTGNSFHMPTNPNAQRFLEVGLPKIDPAVLGALIASLIVIGSVLVILLLYVGSVMRFILFDSVIAKQCEIGSGWARRQGIGFRYFLWNLGLLAAWIGGLAILVGIPALIAFAMGWLRSPREHLVPMILGGMFLFFLLMAFFAVWMLVQVFTKDFVVPQMALENIGAMEGWRRLMPQLSAEKGGYAGYAVMKIVMALGAAVVVGIVTVIVLLILLIPIGGAGVVAVLLGKTAGLTWNLYTITLAVVVGCGLLALLMYVMAVISVPAIVFFPAYSIYFFAARYPALDALLRPAGIAQLPPLPPEPIG
jgi:hypothetical protein